MIIDSSFFGTNVMPQMDLKKSDIKELANKSVQQGKTVAGVQKKLSLALSKGKDARLTLVDYPNGYILKPQTEEYDNLPEAEDLVMDLCAMMGIQTAPHGLIKIEDEWAYITKRVDRSKAGQLAMEDFCQLSKRQTEDKYKGSYERCVGVIHEYSSRSGLDKTEFFLRIVASYITGNSDMHLKNFSLIETAPGNRIFVLSPAYDLLPVNVLLPEDEDELALTLNGKRSNFERADFIMLADKCGMTEKVADRLIDRIITKMPELEAMINSSEMTENNKEELIALMERRTKTLMRR